MVSRVIVVSALFLAAIVFAARLGLTAVSLPVPAESSSVVTLSGESPTPDVQSNPPCPKEPPAACAAKLALEKAEEAGLDRTEFLPAMVAAGLGDQALEYAQQEGVDVLDASEQILKGMAHAADWAYLDQLVELSGSEKQERAVRLDALKVQLDQDNRDAAKRNLTELKKLSGDRGPILEGYVRIQDLVAAEGFANEGDDGERIQTLGKLADLLDDAGNWKEANRIRKGAQALTDKQGMMRRLVRRSGDAAGAVAASTGRAVSTSVVRIAGASKSSWSMATSWVGAGGDLPKMSDLALEDAETRLDGYELIVAAADTTSRSAAAVEAYKLAKTFPDDDRAEALARVVPMLARAGLTSEALSAAYEIDDHKLQARTAAQLALDLSTRPAG